MTAPLRLVRKVKTIPDCIKVIRELLLDTLPSGRNKPGINQALECLNDIETNTNATVKLMEKVGKYIESQGEFIEKMQQANDARK